jgi:D-lactate dehydrogenase (cytochrome)
MHRIIARRARDASEPCVDRDPAIVASFLSDAAHVAGGYAAGVAFPRSEAEVASLVRNAERVLPVGAQSSLTGGATPRGELVLSTRALSMIGDVIGPVLSAFAKATADRRSSPEASGGWLDRPDGHHTIRVGAGVPLTTLQTTLTASRLYYPPVPTFEGAFVGGTISTNAAGAATFKYGSTRPWVAGITVVLANGEVLDLRRGEVTATPDGIFEVELPSGGTIVVPVPTYRMPNVAKLSAGYYATPAMDLIDLFIGSEGTLGVIVEATLRVIPRPRRAVALIRCDSDSQAVTVTGALRGESLARRSAKGEGGSVSAIEYMDARALRVVPNDAFARAGVARPDGDSVLLMVHIEVESDDAAAFERLQDLLDSCDVADEATIASPDDDRGQQKLLELREAVPASVNAVVAAAKARAHPDIEKTAGDMVVPFSRLAESIALYRQAFESRGLEYAIWGHVSDGNLHPNLIPRTLEDMTRGREAILEIARGVIGMDGAPLAEHGVGRSALKQRLLRELYGEDGIEQMRAVKRALDPNWKLAPGVLFSA